MTTSEQSAPAPPFRSAYVILLLLGGPAAVEAPDEADEALRAELREAWGRNGERIGRTWLANEGRLREQARIHGIPARFNGRFFGECQAADEAARGDRR